MKRFLIAAVLVLLTALSSAAQTIHAPKGFAGKVWNSTFALYGTKGKTTHFVCTAEAIAKSRDGYVLLTAGHCVQEVPAGLQFSVSDEIEGPRTPVTLIKVYEGRGEDPVDFALFDLKTTKKISILKLGTDDDIRIGGPTLNVHFAEGINKQLSYGVVSSQPIPKSENCAENGCLGNFLVQEYAGPGASGSAVISSKTHRLIGILVEQTEAPSGFAVEPISRLQKFTSLPKQAHPDEAGNPDDNPAIRIPDADYQSLFGPSHPFTLTVHGPNPRFTQNGYTFVANVLGMELSDDYYYNVPVYISEDEDGTFRLVSTKDGYSVGVAVVQAPEKK